MSRTPNDAIGIIGVGKMGEPIAHRLLDEGATVLIPPRSRDASQRLAARGAIVVADFDDLVSSCPTILMLLPSPAEADAVATRLSAIICPDQLVIEHGTVGPDLADRIAERVHARGGLYLDAPVSGGPGGAVAGTLTAMVGGAEATLQRARLVLDIYCGKVRLCGPTGAGQVVKLVNQLLVALHTAASAEAAAFAEALGADPDAMLDVVSSSFGASRMMERNLPRIVARDFSGATPVSVILKDLGLITAAGRRAPCWLPMAELATHLFARGIGAGIGDDDMSGLVRLWEAASGEPSSDEGRVH